MDGVAVVVAFVAPRDVIGSIELMRGIAAAVGSDSVKDLVDESCLPEPCE